MSGGARLAVNVVEVGIMIISPMVSTTMLAQKVGKFHPQATLPTPSP